MIQNVRRNPPWNPDSMTIPEIWNLRNKLIENQSKKTTIELREGKSGANM